MKKIKVMFTAVAMLAVIGGALAFKSSKLSSFDVYKKSADGLTCPYFGTYDTWISGPFVTVTNAVVATSQPAVSTCINTLKLKAE